MKTFKVGDVVAIVSRSHINKSTVKRVMKRFVELEDGSKWRLNGGEYPRSKDVWRFTNIRHMTSEYKEKIKRNKLLRDIIKWESKNTSTDCLKRIVEIINES